MEESQVLQGLKILITRPEHQAKSIANKIEALGAQALICPTIQIIPTSLSATMKQRILELEQYHIAIFNSYNAVTKLQALIKQLGIAWPKSLKVLAIGNATAHALLAIDISVMDMPERDYSSESLLNLELLKRVEDKKIIIFAGVGGRELLEETLSKRGALVTKAEVYKREKPALSTSMQKILQTIDYNYIISMSGDSLNNLIAMVAKERQASLYQIPLLIISKRMALVAQALGFKDILIAQNASEEALIAALVSRRREEHDARGSKYRDF